LQHQIIRDEVLERRHIETSIDQYGLRNTRKPEDARIFAIGDSFCFGYHITQDATWTSLLDSMLGEPVYNMGVSASSPLQQQLLLEYILREYPKEFRPEKLLWTIYEGNDLEDQYQVKGYGRQLVRRAFEGTLVELIASVPGQIRQQSFIRRLSEGRLTLGNRPEAGQRSDHYMLGGSRMPVPLYYSPRFGHMFLPPSALLRAGKPLSYVRDHPNRVRLKETFHRMREISRQHKFEVTVVIVPTVVRLYKDYIDDLPPVTDEPHFINYLKELSAELGFKTINLHDSLASYASSEFLYQRDDTHWNERGHQIVANLLEENVPLRAP
jgi:hypothetical protein